MARVTTIRVLSWVEILCNDHPADRVVAAVSSK